MSTAPRAKRATTTTRQAQKAAPRGDNFGYERMKARNEELECQPSTAALPKLGDELYGGYFSGIVSGADGVPYVLVLHAARLGSDVDWHAAQAWARSLECDLPNRCEAAMLISIHGITLGSGQIWTNEDYHREASYAWLFHGNGGRTVAESKSITAVAIAVRRVQLGLGDGQALVVDQPIAPAPTAADGGDELARQIKASELHGLCGSIQSMDSYAQESLKQISAVASLALKSLETPSGQHDTESIAQVLTLIGDEAMALQGRISYEAEIHGCQWRDEAETRRSDAARGA